MGLPTLYFVASFCKINFAALLGESGCKRVYVLTSQSPFFQLFSCRAGNMMARAPSHVFLDCLFFPIFLTASGWDPTHTVPARIPPWEGGRERRLVRSAVHASRRFPPQPVNLCTRPVLDWATPSRFQVLFLFLPWPFRGLSVGHDGGSFVSSYDSRLLASLWVLPCLLSHWSWGSWETH